MQQIALPSLDAPRKRGVVTPAFPLVRRTRSNDAATQTRSRKFAAGLLFGVLASLTLVLLGYEARLYSDQHPGVWRHAVEAVAGLGR